MSRVRFKETATPATPPTDYQEVYVGTDGKLKKIDDTGAVVSYDILSTEDVQDAIGAAFTDTASIDFTYNDPANTVSAVVLPAGVDHDALSNFVANEHIDHSAVSITAGNGLTGGGDITTSRTLNIADTAVTPAAYGSATQVGTFTVDQQGRLTAAASTSISIPSTQVNDFTEAVQDVVGAYATSGQNITVTYNDGANTLTFDETNLSVTLSKTANYMITSDDFKSRTTILCDTSGGAFTLTLPNPSGLTGRITIKDVVGLFGTNNLTIARFGSEKIDNLASNFVLQADYSGKNIITNGTDWFFV